MTNLILTCLVFTNLPYGGLWQKSNNVWTNSKGFSISTNYHPSTIAAYPPNIQKKLPLLLNGTNYFNVTNK